MIQFILLIFILVNAVSAIDFDGIEGESMGYLDQQETFLEVKATDSHYVLVQEFKSDEGMQPHPSHKLTDTFTGLDFAGSTVDTKTSRIVDGPYKDKCIAQKDQFYWTAIVCGSLTTKRYEEELSDLVAKYGVPEEPFWIEYIYTADGGQVPIASIPNFNPKSKADREKLSEKVTKYINQNPGSKFEKVLRKPGVLLDDEGLIKLTISDINNEVFFWEHPDKRLIMISNFLNLDGWVPVDSPVRMPKLAPNRVGRFRIK